MRCFYRIFVFVIAMCIAGSSVTVRAEELPADTVDIGKMLEAMPAEAVGAFECSTGKPLFFRDTDRQLPISHLAKLMTALIATERIEAGELSLDEEITVSAGAASAGGAVIWLEKGDRITVRELMISVTVGNANDACVALAERIAGSEEAFVELMQKRAEELGMDNTVFADCTGLSESTVSTASDLALLSAEVIKHKELKEWYTTWMTDVRDGRAELVSQNRLVRTYKGILGLKACASKTAGECACIAAERNGMSVVVVILGCDTSDNREQIAKKLLDMSFDCFSLYTPEITDEMTAPVPVTGGVKDKASVKLSGIKGTVIPRGAGPSVEISFEREEKLKAPVHKGDKVGTLTLTLDGEEIMTAELIADQNVAEAGWGFYFKYLLCKLL